MSTTQYLKRFSEWTMKSSQQQQQQQTYHVYIYKGGSININKVKITSFILMYFLSEQYSLL